MIAVRLPVDATFAAWRDAARRCLAAALPPHEVEWTSAPAQGSLFGDAPAPVALAAPMAAAAVPRAFVDLAGMAACHTAPERFALLYRLLWRLTHGEHAVLGNPADADVARVTALAKAVRRDIHKMHAFLRFREVQAGGETRFVAWFEPEHYILAAAAPFFAGRFASMAWTILTPGGTAHGDSGTVRFGPGTGRAAAPDGDRLEDLWRTYYASIFNPARLKLAQMRSEMPKKYWRNLPEAELIAPLAAAAAARTGAMVAAAPSPGRTRIPAMPARSPLPPADAIATIARDLAGCRECPLWRNATQAVPGEGPAGASIMLVGEQPGDHEDLEGRPFVGPAGAVLDAALAAAGLDRGALYVTNAVKHFKNVPRGKKRIHQRPDRGEVQKCSVWFRREVDAVRPGLIVALGATAAAAVFGRTVTIGATRGRLIAAPHAQILVTVHPSYLLRLPDPASRDRERTRFIADLGLARAWLEQRP